jgi:hypothetical protein
VRLIAFNTRVAPLTPRRGSPTLTTDGEQPLREAAQAFQNNWPLVAARLLLTSTLFNWDGNMNTFTFRARRSVVVLSVSIACSLPVLAQSTANGGSSGAGTGTTTTTRDDGRDYGWLGLLGLVGLLGLRRRPDDHRDVNRTTTTSR